jgi:hypothetical protein
LSGVGKAADGKHAVDVANVITVDAPLPFQRVARGGPTPRVARQKQQRVAALLFGFALPEDEFTSETARLGDALQEIRITDLGSGLGGVQAHRRRRSSTRSDALT